MRIAVAGGTGVVGRHVVAAAAGAGHEPVVLARSVGVDVTTGRGLAAALDGAEAVIDVSNIATTRRRRSVAFFEAASEQLLTAGREVGVGHHVVLSIVGIDRVDFGYYEGKRRQEELVLAGPLPASVLRTTQFHEFAGQLMERSPGPVALVPRMRVQPIAAREVAAALVALAVGPAVGRAPELAGPEVHELVDLARRVARAAGQRRPVLSRPAARLHRPRDGGRRPAADRPRPARCADVHVVAGHRRLTPHRRDGSGGRAHSPTPACGSLPLRLAAIIGATADVKPSRDAPTALGPPPRHAAGRATRRHAGCGHGGAPDSRNGAGSSDVRGTA